MNNTDSKFKQTDIGLIPEDWDINEINEWATVEYGKANPKTTGEIPLVGSGGIFGSVKEPLVDYATLVIGRKGTAGSVQKFDKPSYPTDTTFFLKWKKDSPPLEMIYNWFLINPLSGLHAKTTIPSLQKPDVENYQFPLPPLPEQKKIAHVLSKIQQAIETQEQIVKTTQELKKALMQKLFTEGLNGEPQKQTEIGLIPESWEVVPMGKYAKILNGYAFKSEDYIKNGVPLIRISNVSFGYLISKDDKYLPKPYIDRYSDYALKEGDLILSLTRPVTSGGMKYCFIDKKHLPALLNQRVGRFKIIDEGLSKKYLFHLVFSKYFIGELEKLFGNSSQQPNVSPSQLESFKIPLPPKPEQIEIANTLNSINSKIEYSQNKVETLKYLFTSSLNKLMTGHIRVKGEL